MYWGFIGFFSNLVIAFDSLTTGPFFLGVDEWPPFVSKVNLKECDCNLTDYGFASLSVDVNNGIICQRCWNRIDELDICEDNLCKRCNDVVKGQ